MVQRHGRRSTGLPCVDITSRGAGALGAPKLKRMRFWLTGAHGIGGFNRIVARCLAGLGASLEPAAYWTLRARGSSPLKSSLVVSSAVNGGRCTSISRYEQQCGCAFPFQQCCRVHMCRRQHGSHQVRASELTHTLPDTSRHHES